MLNVDGQAVALPDKVLFVGGRREDPLRYFEVETLLARDKASLDDLENLPPPDVLAQEIIEHLESALMSFREVANGLPRSGT